MSDTLFTPLHWLASHSLSGMAAALFAMLLVAMESCYRLGRRAVRDSEVSEGLKTATGIVTGAMLGLFAFLLSVMFSLAADRYEKRRQSVLDEANAIGTSWLRAGLVEPEGPALRALLRNYVPLRIALVRGETAPEAEAGLVAETGRLQGEMWALVTRAAVREPTPVMATVVTTFNETFDLATTNRRNFRRGVPSYVLRLVLGVAVLSVGAMGYQFGIHGHRQLGVTILLLLTWTLVVGLVLDLDSARLGSVFVDPAPLIWTLEGWGPP